MDSVQQYFSDADNVDTEFFTEADWLQFEQVDSSVLHFHRFNPARKPHVPFAYLSNLGAPYYDRFFRFDRTLGFDLGRNHIALYQNQIHTLRYFRTNAPFTDIFYLLGTKGEQWIRFIHTQNFGPRFNVALNFDKPIAAGYYLSERKSYSNFDLTSWWRSKNNRYKIYFGFIFNEVDNEENGGIAVDTLFAGYEGPRNLAETLRTDALTEWRSFQAQLTQTMDFGVTQTIAVDDTTLIKKFIPRVQLLYRMGAADFDYSFRDATENNAYYPQIFAESDTLTDITDVDGFYNFISFGNYAIPSYDSSRTHLFREVFIRQ
ncbi:MAG: putative porin, partial [Chitinophagales bacterium]